MSTPGSPRLRRLDARQLDRADRESWSALADRAVEPNPFFRPEFALANMADRGVPLELLVVADDAAWLACLPIRRRSASLRVPIRSIEAMTDDYSFLGTPLLDRDRVDRGADGLMALVASIRSEGVLVVGAWAPDGPVAAAITRAATRRGMRPVVLSAVRRAAWHRSSDGRSPGARLPGDDRKKLASRARHLAEALGGELRVVDRSQDPGAVDAFLEMENSGWKAERGNPMAARPGDARFFRRMAAEMGATGRFELLALEGGDRTVAMETHLIDGDALYSFKIAHDPAFRAYSPGTQLKAHVMDRLDERGFRIADSCASPGNAHMNRLWPDQRPLQVLLIPTGAISGRLVRPLVAARSMARAARERFRSRGGDAKARAQVTP